MDMAVGSLLVYVVLLIQIQWCQDILRCLVFIIFLMKHYRPARRHMRLLMRREIIAFEVEPSVYACDGDRLAVG